MRRHVLAAGGLWLVLTVTLLALAIAFPLLPPAASDKGHDIDAAFRFLLYLSVPVFAFVVAVLVYSVVRFRRGGEPPADGSGDGAPLHGRGRFPVAWFWLTSALALTVMVYPGLTELPRLAAVDPAAELVVKVEGFQWAWRATYPDQAVETTQELVLPVDRSVRFEITSLDVIHAFWVPAFAMKIDAVPGLTTRMSLRPTTLGDYRTDPLFRLQCSQLCGGSHAVMRLPVRVVTAADWDAWVTENTTAGPTATPIAGAAEIEVAAENPPGTVDFVFSVDRLEAPAGPLVIRFHNRDTGIIHNIAVYTRADELIGDRTAFETGPVEQTLALPAMSPGAYIFKCDAHPRTMFGTLEIK